MSEVKTSAGTTFALSADAPTTHDETGYSALVYTDVGEVTNIPEYGGTYQLVTHEPLASRAVVKRKGSLNHGSLTLQIGKDINDAGQALLKTAYGEDEAYSFEITLQDGTIHYTTGQVFSFTTNVGNSNQITGISCKIELDTEIIEVAASAS
jgi:hypothetical protein